MYTGFLHLHTVVRWVVIALFGVVLVRAFLRRGQAYEVRDRKLLGALVGTFHLQVIIGLVLHLVLSPITKAAMADMGVAMKNAGLRFFAVEHLTMMLLAAVLITVASVRVKKAEEPKKYQTTLTMVGATLVLVLVAVPWPFRGEGVRRGLFPGHDVSGAVSSAPQALPSRNE
jgi:cell division protein FtsW (lipid II flippase)